MRGGAPTSAKRECRLPGKEYGFVPFSVKVKPRTLAKMRVLKDRLEKRLKKPINWDEAFEEIPHEQIAHQTLIQDETAPSEHWQVAITPNRDGPANAAKYFIDRLVQKYRHINGLKNGEGTPEPSQRPN